VKSDLRPPQAGKNGEKTIGGKSKKRNNNWRNKQIAKIDLRRKWKIRKKNGKKNISPEIHGG